LLQGALQQQDYAAAAGGSSSSGVHGSPKETARLTHLSPPNTRYVGEVTRVDPTLLNSLVSSGYIPVVATVATDETGQALNVNADTAAGEIAAALQAEKLILMTDVPGVLRDKDDVSTKFAELNIKRSRELMQEGIIAGGMIPKVRPTWGWEPRSWGVKDGVASARDMPSSFCGGRSMVAAATQEQQHHLVQQRGYYTAATMVAGGSDSSTSGCGGSGAHRCSEAAANSSKQQRHSGTATAPTAATAVPPRALFADFCSHDHSLAPQFIHALHPTHVVFRRSSAACAASARA
jgi:hypothetical protein